MSSQTDVTMAPRDPWLAVRRGWSQTCPSCGRGSLYRAFLKVNDACPACAAELHHHRADDAPPYFVMVITAHVIVAGVLLVEQNYPMNAWLEFAIFAPMLVLLSLWLLPRIKGALIGYQWALRMHGFGAGAYEGADLPPAQPTAPVPN